LTRKFFIIGVILLIMAFMSIDAGAEKGEAFVDQDGDGFNDNISDSDNNGIPDRYESDIPEMFGEVKSSLGDVFNTEISMSDVDEFLSKSEKFDIRQFKARGLLQRCNGFGASDGFGPGNDIGLGAVSGSGGCAGGVCSP